MPSPHLTFLGWDRPILPAAAGHLVDHYTRNGTADLRGATVVLPGRRARRRVIELLIEAAAARSVTLIPPAVTTVGHVPGILHTPARPTVDEAVALRAWSRALRSTDPEAVRPVFPHLQPQASLREWDGLARVLRELHRTLAGEGHRFADVARLCRSGVLFDDSPRWEVLAAVQRRYLALLDGAGMADPFETRIAALEAGVRPFEGDIWLVAVAEIPAVTRRLLEASGATLHALVHAPAGLADQSPAPFDAWGLPVTEVWEGARVPVTDEVLRMVERPVDQADAAVDALADLEGRYTTEDVILGVHPEAEVVPYLQQRLAARGVGARTAAGIPLTRTAPALLLQATADYLDGHTYPALAALLRHPDTGSLLASAGLEVSGARAVDAADAYFREHLPHTMGGPIPAGRLKGADVPSLVRALDLEGPLRPFRGRRRLSAWMPVVMRFLQETYGQGELDRSRPEHRRLIEILLAIRSEALSLDPLPASLDEECTGAEAIRVLLSGLGGKALPPDPDPAAVELLEWLEVPLDDAPVLVLTGFNEGFLPESVTGHPFLPDSLCRLLGVLDNRRRMARDAYRLTCVLHSRERVRLIAGRRSAQGDPLRPSRLMFRTAPEELPRRVLHFLDEGEGPAEGTRLAALGLEPARTTSFAVPPEPVLELSPEQIPDKLSVTAFRSLLADEYRFVLEQVLELRRVDDQARELDALGFGSLAHGALQRFGQRAVTEPQTVDLTDADATAELLVTLLHEEVERQFGRSVLPAVLLQAAQLEERLKAFAGAQAKWAAEGWRIAAVECAPEGAGWPLDVDGTPLLVRGRIDRIDHNPATGAWAVLDYKTGSRASTPEETHRTGRAGARVWVDLQLPLYRHMLPSIVDADGARVVPPEAVSGARAYLGYILLPEDPAACGFILADWSDAELDGALERARGAVRTLRKGSFAYDASATRPGAEGQDPLRPLLLVGWQAGAGPEADPPGEAGASGEVQP